MRASPSLTVIMTVHNRRDVTLRCLHSLSRQLQEEDSFSLSCVVVDDGSTDGTAEAIRDSRWPFPIHVVRGSGDLFWARGMALAQSEATAVFQPNYLLWLNDDVVLRIDAISRLLAASQKGPEAIAVGATEWDGRVSYGGQVRRSWRPGSLKLVEPSQYQALAIDTFHGNIVLIPERVFTAIGCVDSEFRHGYGDIDYGLRAKARGAKIELAAGWFGTCEPNVSDLAWASHIFSRRQRSRLLFSRKAYPIRDHLRYNWRHAGPIGGTVAAMGTYARALTRIWLRQ